MAGLPKQQYTPVARTAALPYRIPCSCWKFPKVLRNGVNEFLTLQGRLLVITRRAAVSVLCPATYCRGLASVFGRVSPFTIKLQRPLTGQCYLSVHTKRRAGVCLLLLRFSRQYTRKRKTRTSNTNSSSYLGISDASPGCSPYRARKTALFPNFQPATHYRNKPARTAYAALHICLARRDLT